MNTLFLHTAFVRKKKQKRVKSIILYLFSIYCIVDFYKRTNFYFHTIKFQKRIASSCVAMPQATQYLPCFITIQMTDKLLLFPSLYHYYYYKTKFSDCMSTLFGLICKVLAIFHQKRDTQSINFVLYDAVYVCRPYARTSIISIF